jgi:EAL domain-containing protein (putative c-di-GMP-specific phosphodiesterase class I)/CHASE2 domain-containing sensor protein/GGDEF domain-containing protein
MSLLRRLAGGARRFGGLFLVVACVVAAMASGVLRPVDDGFAYLRFGLLRRPASQALTVVEIDARSVRAAGRWPWPRDRFAAAIANLEAAGARIVAFDVDFSLRSSAAADRRMAEAISAQPGMVVLPTFVQPADRSALGRMVQTNPLAGLADDALVASVNIPIDPDGRARRYRYGFGEDETYRPSMGALLAGVPGQRVSTFLIDYAVDPRGVPHLSFEDVLQNRFDRSKVKGRTILVGARAIELGDTFSTPPYGTVNGVYLHALAFEQLRLGRGLLAPHPALTAALALLLAFLLRADRKGASLASVVRRNLLAAAALLVVPVALQALFAVSLPVGPLALCQALCLVWATRSELRRRAKAIIAEREAGLLHIAMHDPETALPNRRALVGEIASRIGPDLKLAVIAVGIDRYAAIRGAVGYSLSSELVREVAARIEAGHPGSVVAHLSTSALGLVLCAPDAESLAREIARLERLDPGYLVDGHAVDAHVRFGVAPLDGDEADAEALLEHATLALDAARREDRDLVVFDPATLAETRVNLALMSDMERGLSDGQFELHYQPKLDARTGAISGAEGLIRWRHPVQGAIRPDIFVGMAEETGRIRELTLWTVARALEDADRLKAAGRAMMLSVNISGRLIADSAFCKTVLAMARGRETTLCLEITETAVISSPEGAQASIAAFRAAGLKVSIDDYGAGLSSLSYLKMIEADELKLDRTLVLSVVESLRDRMILRSTVDLAHGLGMTVVAEGVETAEISAVLTALGCDLIQGYLVARPMPLAELEAFLERREAA